MFKNLKSKLEQNIGASLSTATASSGRVLGANSASLSNIKPSTSNQSLTSVTGSLKLSGYPSMPPAPESGDSKPKSTNIDAILMPSNSHASSNNQENVRDLIDIGHNDLLISTSPPTLPTENNFLPSAFIGESNVSDKLPLDSLESSRRGSRDQISDPLLSLRLSADLVARDALIKELEANLIRSQNDFREKLAAEEREKNVWKIACADLRSASSSTNTNSASFQKQASAAAAAELQALRTEVTKLTQINRSFDVERVNLQKENSNVASQLAELRSRYAENKVDTEAIHAQLNHALEQLATPKPDIPSAQSVDTAATEQQARQTEELRKLTESLKAENDELKLERDQLELEKQARDESLQQIEQQIEILRTEAERVKTEIDERDTTISSLRQTLQAKLTAAEQKLEGAEIYYTELEGQLQAKQQELDDIVEQNKIKGSQFDQLNEELQTARANHASVTNELKAKTDEFEEQIRIKQQEILAVAGQNNDQSLLFDRLNDKLRTVRASHANLSSELQDKTGEFEKQLQVKQQELLSIAEQNKNQILQFQKIDEELQSVRASQTTLTRELEARTNEVEALRLEKQNSAAATADAAAAAVADTNDQQQQTVASVEAAQLRMLKHALSQHFTLPPFSDAGNTTATDSGNNHAFVDAVVTSISALKDAKAALGAQLERLIGDCRSSKTRIADLERQLDDQRQASIAQETAFGERFAGQAEQVSALNQRLADSAAKLDAAVVFSSEAQRDDGERKKLEQLVENLQNSAQEQRLLVLSKCEELRNFSHTERAAVLQVFNEAFTSSVADARASISDSFTDFTAQMVRNNAAALQRQHFAALDEASELTSKLERKIISLDEQLDRLHATHAASDFEQQKLLEQSVEAEKQSTRNALDAARSEYDTLNERYARLEEQHENVMLEVERINTQLDSERSAREDAESHVGRTKDELQRLTTSSDTATAQFEQLKQSNKRVIEERSALQEQIDFLKQDLNVLLESKTTLETRLDAANVYSDELEQRLKIQSDNAEQLEKSLTVERERVEKHQQDHKQAVVKMKQLEETSRTTEAVASNQKNLNQQFRADIDRLETSLKAKQREYETQAQILDETCRERDSKQAELDSLAAEHRHTLDSLQTLARELTATRSEAEATRETNSSRTREQDEKLRELETRVRQFQHDASQVVELRSERDDALRQAEQLRADVKTQREEAASEVKAALERRVTVETQVDEDELHLALNATDETAVTNGIDSAPSHRRQTREQLVQQLNSANQEAADKTKALKKQQLRINELKKLVKEVRNSGGSGGGNNIFGGSSAHFADDNISLGSNADSTSANVIGPMGSHPSQQWQFNSSHHHNAGGLANVRKATSYNDLPAGATSGGVDVNTPLLLLNAAQHQQQHVGVGGYGDAGAFMSEHVGSSTPPPATLMPTLLDSNSKHAAATGCTVYRDDINFEYMKNVLLKFLGSTHDEAVHLVKPVVTLLHLTPDEEEWLNRVVAWREGSWFSALTAAKPAKGGGATQAKKVGSGAVGGPLPRSGPAVTSSLISSNVSSNNMSRPVPGSAAALAGVGR